ncbi:MAG TPA: glycine cleavage system protein GcvH [Syntrophomonadaceae bacterium]|nr:glycine cleavage system protein GcvH [Syntrophomonadaceae bacterium]
MDIRKDLLYSDQHEWVRIEDDKAFIGITDYAQENLGDIVFVEMPEVDREVEAEEAVGVIESVKAVADLFSPVSGTIVEINEELEDAPQLLNEEPYEQHILVVSMSELGEADDLMNADDYARFCEEEEQRG